MSLATRLSVLLLSSCAAAAFPAWSDGNSEHGKELYESRCFACHSVDANRVGPMHMGVFGRKAGSIADFDYSKSVKKSKIVWNEKTLDKWLTNPESLIPGQKMGYQVPDPADRADIIAYLMTLKDEGK
jgi:cytochrome c